MCLPSAPKDNSAQLAREAEQKRQAAINKGTASIDQQFAQFNDPYYQGIQQSALDYYTPDLNTQATNTREALVKNLARSGNLSGSAGAEQLSDLEEQIARQQAGIADKARGIAQNARASVDSNRANLLSQLSATADPYAAATAASAAANQLSAPQQFSPLGDLFSKFGNAAATQIAAAKQGYKNPTSGFISPASSGGSATYVS